MPELSKAEKENVMKMLYKFSRIGLLAIIAASSVYQAYLAHTAAHIEQD